MAEGQNISTDQQELARYELLARRALAHWGLADARLWLLKNRENCVFGVEQEETGKLQVLRIHRLGYRSTANLLGELQWLEALAEAGINVPRAIATATGELVAVIEEDNALNPRLCDLLSWVEGEQIGTIEGLWPLSEAEMNENFLIAGQLAAEVHNHGASWPRPAGFVRPVMDAEGLIGHAGYLGDPLALEALSEEQAAILATAKARIFEALDRFGKGSDRYGLVHGDFLPENLLQANGKLSLVDFDDCGFGWYMMDMATALFFLLGEPQFDAVSNAFVDGYRSRRPLPDDHLAMLPLFFLARGLTYLGWCQSRADTPEAKMMAPQMVDAIVAMAIEFIDGE